MKNENIQMPSHLSENSKKIWKSVVPSNARTSHRKVLILAALESLDRAEEARLIIAEEGMLLPAGERTIAHVHPLLKVERDSRALFAKLWNQLNLQYEPHKF